MSTCCFTGHRPDKLGGYDYNSEKNLLIKKHLFKVCENLILTKKVDKFVVGGALGFDQMSFDVLYELKQLYALKIIVAVPFKLQYSNWPQKSIDYYKQQLDNADEIVFVDTLDKYKVPGFKEGTYNAYKMQQRNKYMVDISDYLVTYFDGTLGGTANCIRYWKDKKEEEPINIFDAVNKTA